MSNRIRQITSLTIALGSVEEGILTRCVLFVSTEESFHGTPRPQNLRRPSTRGHTRTACVTINVGRKRTGDKWDSPSRGAPMSTPLHYMYVYIYTYIYTHTHTHYTYTIYRVIHQTSTPPYFYSIINLLKFFFLKILNILTVHIFKFLRFLYYLRNVLCHYKLLFFKK
jgi:hypothetical protein